MIEINIFDVYPLNLKVVFEFMAEIIPPIGKYILNQTAFQFSNGLKHPTFDNAKKQIYLFMFRFGFYE
jgi:hypothetical protein